MSLALASSKGGTQRAARSANIGNIAAPGGHDLFIAFAVDCTQFAIDCTQLRGLITGPAADEVKFM